MDSIKEAITKDQKQYLWKDELGDDFLITKHCEIFLLDDNLIRCWFWARKKFLEIHKEIIFFNIDETDDPLILCTTSITNLDKILEAGKFKKRPHKNGKWLKEKAERLGHDIIPYRTKLKE